MDEIGMYRVNCCIQAIAPIFFFKFTTRPSQQCHSAKSRTDDYPCSEQIHLLRKICAVSMDIA